MFWWKPYQKFDLEEIMANLGFPEVSSCGGSVVYTKKWTPEFQFWLCLLSSMRRGKDVLTPLSVFLLIKW